MENILARLDQLAADQVGGEEAEQRQCHKRNDEAETWNFYREISLRPIDDRNERSHQIIDPIDEPPGETDRDVEGPDQNEAGQKVIAQPADHPVVGGLLMFGVRSAGYRRTQYSRVSIELGHVTMNASLVAWALERVSVNSIQIPSS